jgi:transposase
LREPSDKPSGGQKGHKGETLRQVAEPDRIVDHYPSACTVCGAAVTPAMSAGHSARQVFDLPEPTPLVVTEHRVHDCRCTGCGARSRASFPDEVKAPVQYGPRIAAVVIYLLHYQLLPEDRLAELMADLFGIRLVAATIARTHHVSSLLPPSITPSFDARPYIAPTLRFSLRAITVFVFSRVSVLSMRTSSFVQGRLRVTFFAISFSV